MMNKTGFLIVALGVVLLSCNQNNSKTETANSNFVEETTMEQIENLQELDTTKVKKEIQNLVRKMLNWAESDDVVDVLPLVADDDDVVIGFDLDKHKATLNALRATGFFAEEFIENYNKIIVTLDKKVRNNEFGEFFITEMPPLRFATGASPWCNCQDVPYDNPNPWDDVEIEVIKLNNDRAQVIWKWGRHDLNSHPSVTGFTYTFSTEKENGKWKIAYMEEFDFEISTKKY